MTLNFSRSFIAGSLAYLIISICHWVCTSSSSEFKDIDKSVFQLSLTLTSKKLESDSWTCAIHPSRFINGGPQYFEVSCRKPSKVLNPVKILIPDPDYDPDQAEELITYSEAQFLLSACQFV